MHAYLIVSAIIALCLTPALGQNTEPMFAAHPERSELNIEYFKEYLSKCPEHEIRCLWFLGGDPKVGMVMTLDLKLYSVYTVRDVFDWAKQNGEKRRLSEAQLHTASSLRSALPAGSDGVEFGKGLHISFWSDGRLQQRTYDRTSVPSMVRRLYDLGGGGVDCRFDDSKPKSDKVAPKQAAIRPLPK